MKLSGLVKYRLAFPPLGIQALACNKPLGTFPDPTHCRACSVEYDMITTAVPLKWYETHQGRIYEVEWADPSEATDEQKASVTRLIAFVYGHSDPLDLTPIEELETAYEH